ncbi:MAG: hypothetical protein H0T46_37510 [Deltaproteobacteria bacterium]|nr:hypothetical protein [Deltaproteobacteria bacterium]
MKLGTLLLRNAAIGLSQLEGALRNQVLYGGRLGTNLVELGYIDLELLSGYLAELSGFPMATPTLLDEADPELLEKVGSDEAHRLRSIPLGYLGDAKDTVAVGMVDPTDTDAKEQLTLRLGAKITPYVVPELRALYYLERLFGTPRRARFVRTARAGSEADPPHDDRRRQQPAQGMVMPPAFTLEPRRRRSSQQVTSGSSVPHAMSYSAACERIDTCTHRETIADTLVEYAKGRCDALVVFLIRDANAVGWRGWTAPPAAPKTPIEELSLPLGGASSLQSAHDSGEAFVGPSPSDAKPVELELWAALGATPEPIDVVVIPILVKQRAVNLIYAHTLVGPPPQFLITELLDLAVRAQTSYLRLIKSARGS